MQAYLFLFNRGSNFQYSFIPELLGFVPVRVTPANMRVREQLSLAVPNNDYHEISYLSLLDRYPDIKALLAQPQDAFTVEDYIVPQNQLLGAKLEVTELGTAGIQEAPRSLPVNLIYNVNFRDAGQVEVNSGSFNTVFNYSSTGLESGQQRLAINFDDSVPLEGAVFVDKWEEGDFFSFIYQPKSFPYDLAFDRVTAKRDYTELLAELDLEDEFLTKFSKREKLAVIIIALINQTHGSFKSNA